jgi:DNA-binding Lrp family transcriptional regulator
LKIDSTDIEILKILRKDARASVAGIARTLGISVNATRMRYNKIQKSGIIKKTFMPTFLPQYALSKNKTYRMQIIVRTTNVESSNVIKTIRNLNIDRSQIECWETIGHFNILVWIISENPIDLHFVQDKIQTNVGVLEIKACILLEGIESYSKVNLEHLTELKVYG